MSSKRSRSEPVWIDKQALLLLHEESLAEFGGSRGLRDEGLLDSALARRQHTLTYKPASTLAELAASHAFGLAKNHAFVDGNKRAAYLSIGLFLAINGRELKPDPVDAIQTILALASGELTESSLAGWIARNSGPRPWIKKVDPGRRKRP